MTFSVTEQELELIEFVGIINTSNFNPAFEDWELTDEEHEIQDADMLRATTAMSESWEDETDLSIDKMIDDLGALIKVVERKSTYADFVFETDIHNNSYLQ